MNLERFSVAISYNKNTLFVLVIILLSSLSMKALNLPFDQVQKRVNRAQQVLKDVTENEKYSTLLDGKKINLPIGVKKTVGNKEYTILLDSIIVLPTHSYGVFYMVMENPEDGQKMTFLGTDIRFAKDGGFTGNARLELLESYHMPIGKDKAVLSILADSVHHSYVQFDCKGFSHLHVDGRVTFSRDIMIPDDGKGNQEPGFISSEFEIDLVDFTDFFLQIDGLAPFQVPEAEGFTFQVSNFAIDFSEYKNPDSIHFHDDYGHQELFGADLNLWKGVYFNELVVYLPDEFKHKGLPDDQRVELYGGNILIDKFGFTGFVSASPLIPLGKMGSKGNWDMSLDQVYLDFLKGNLRKIGFNGGLNLPVAKEKHTFTYQGLIEPGRQYRVSVMLGGDDTLSMPLWGASNVELYTGSYIEMKVVDKQFEPKAVLNGQMSISASINNKKKGKNDNKNKKNTLELAEIDFQKLIVQSKKPYLSIDRNGGAFSVGSPLVEQKMSKLPISISDIGVKFSPDGSRAGIDFMVHVNLTGKGKSSGDHIGGKANIVVWGEKDEKRWRYSNTQLQCIWIDMKQGAFSLNGNVCFFRDDNTYGSGFSGSVKVDIVNKIKVSTKMIFGKKAKANKDIFRYWYFDAMVGFSKALVVTPNFQINAIGGGAYHRMTMDNTGLDSEIGRNLSGITYVPDENAGLGLKMMLGIQGATKEVYNGEVNLELQFAKGGGLNYVKFYGFVTFISKIKFDDPLAKLKEKMKGFRDQIKLPSIIPAKKVSSNQMEEKLKREDPGGSIKVEWMMEYNHPARTFSALLDVYIDVANGKLKGIHPYRRAGSIDILFSPSKWHVYMGQPAEPIGIDLVGLAQATSYIVMGSKIPAPMPLPGGLQKSASLDLSKISTGEGFAFGARFRIKKGDKNKRPFYYYIHVGVGFDILFLNVKGKVCNESGKSFGVNNFFAMGQAYMLINGGAGFKKCIWRCKRKKKKKKPIVIHIGFDIGTSVLVQFSAPNPTYADIYVKIYKKHGIRLKLGKKCTF